jgi:hypothetical protein
VTSDYFTNNATWKGVGDDFDQLQLNGRNFEKLDPLECVQRYIEPMQNGKNLVAVTSATSNNITFNDGTSLIAAWPCPDAGIDWDTGQIWICRPGYDLKITCLSKDAETVAKNWTISNTWGEADDGVFPRWVTTIDYCLSAGPSPSNTNCGFHWSSVIMGLVCGLNLVKLVCINCVARWCQEPSLVSKFHHQARSKLIFERSLLAMRLRNSWKTVMRLQKTCASHRKPRFGPKNGANYLRSLEPSQDCDCTLP